MSKYIQVEGGSKPFTTWAGPAPKVCDICHTSIHECFVDGRTIHGRWANMCLPCHGDYGTGLGIGRGQKYCKETGDPQRTHQGAIP